MMISNSTMARVSAFLGLAIVCTLNSYGDDEYRFDRVFPTLKHPWNFEGPSGAAVDSFGNVYIADSVLGCIFKFNADGALITQWGTPGNGPGELSAPRGLAVDPTGNVLVVDTGNHRIQKFTSSGVFVSQWGGFGSSTGKFNSPRDITVDSAGDIYVADTENNRIQKFANNGAFALQWGIPGGGAGQFDRPFAVAAGGVGTVYVADTGNHRIQRFSSVGSFVRTWGNFGSGPGELNSPQDIVVNANNKIYVIDHGNGRIVQFIPSGIYEIEWGVYGRGESEYNAPEALALDTFGNLYIADTGNNRIQKSTLAGVFFTQWSGPGNLPGHFFFPQGLATDALGNLYVADGGNDRIQKFAPDGNVAALIGSTGTGPVQFYYPQGIALDASGNMYVADTGSSRVQKLDVDGNFVRQWGVLGSEEGEFDGLLSIAVDSASNKVFVSDEFPNRVQKFDSDGLFEIQWGGFGSGAGQFIGPRSIATNGVNGLFVADWGNDRVQIFSPLGAFVGQFGIHGTGPGEFDGPAGVAIDGLGNAFVADLGNNRIQKFDSTNTFLSEWGQFGRELGRFVQPDGIAVDPFGNVFVLESQLHRVQKFSPVSEVADSRAIIVAGGGPFVGNNLWDATSLCVNAAYRALIHQGYTRDTIQLLSDSSGLDLDGNGITDDVDGVSSKANLQNALEAWVDGATDLAVFLTGPASDTTFRMSATEVLSSAELAGWLNQAQAQLPGSMILVFDACQSGGFAQLMSAPDRIVIASTGPDEGAYFLNTGALSFSSFFWSNIFEGKSVQESFNTAQIALDELSIPQTAHLEDSASGALAGIVRLGNGTAIDVEPPVIADVSAPQALSNSSSATLTADPVTDNLGVARVTTIIHPPAWSLPSPDYPLLSFPGVELAPNALDEELWTAAFNGFSRAGTYNVGFLARDRDGNASHGVLSTVSVSNPATRKALLVAGGPGNASYSAGARIGTLAAYSALRVQGYTDDDILYYSPTSDPGVDGTNTIGNVGSALSSWANTNTRDLVVYLAGHIVNGKFILVNSNDLTVPEFDPLLDNIQNSITGKVIVIVDASHAESMCKFILPPAGKQRILISSASVQQAALFADDGTVSYSTLFWHEIKNGAQLRQAHAYAKASIRFWSEGPVATLDDNGNGTSNEKTDGAIAQTTRLGVAAILAGNDPVIGTVSPATNLSGSLSAELWAEPVTSTTSIDRVWAVIAPPGLSAANADIEALTDLPVVELVGAKDGRFEGSFDGFDERGDYFISIFARDADGSIGRPSNTSVFQAVGEDPYDINQDGVVNAVDIQLVINGALGLPIAFNADVNGDNTIDAIDVQLVTNAALHL
jgi:sugar lactone lactonase YvrE